MVYWKHNGEILCLDALDVTCKSSMMLRKNRDFESKYKGSSYLMPSLSKQIYLHPWLNSHSSLDDFQIGVSSLDIFVEPQPVISSTPQSQHTNPELQCSCSIICLSPSVPHLRECFYYPPTYIRQKPKK